MTCRQLCFGRLSSCLTSSSCCSFIACSNYCWYFHPPQHILIGKYVYHLHGLGHMRSVLCSWRVCWSLHLGFGVLRSFFIFWLYVKHTWLYTVYILYIYSISRIYCDTLPGSGSVNTLFHARWRHATVVERCFLCGRRHTAVEGICFLCREYIREHGNGNSLHLSSEVPREQ
jgi:ribosomal protein S14